MWCCYHSGVIVNLQSGNKPTRVALQHLEIGQLEHLLSRSNALLDTQQIITSENAVYMHGAAS